MAGAFGKSGGGVNRSPLYKGPVNPVTGQPGQGGGAAYGGATGTGGGVTGAGGVGGTYPSAPAPVPTGPSPQEMFNQFQQQQSQPQQQQPITPTPPPPPMPTQGPQIPWQPQAPQASQISETMSQYGTEMLNPNSPEARRMQEVLTGRIGEETGAAKRLAAFQASQAGMGGGQSQELMAMLGDIDIAGMEQGGRASAEMMTQLPQMGLGFLQGGLGGELGISGQALQGWMTQQQLNQQAQAQNIGSYYQGQNVDLERERMALEKERMDQEAMMNQFAMMFG